MLTQKSFIVNTSIFLKKQLTQVENSQPREYMHNNEAIVETDCEMDNNLTPEENLIESLDL